jgi:hypothetical protein
MPFINTIPQTEPPPRDSEEITRTRAALATGFFRLTLVSPAWLVDLTPQEFETIFHEIIPALEREKVRRKNLDKGGRIALPG